MTPYYQDDSVTIYHARCEEVLPSLSVDIVVTDPPYGTGGWRRPQAGAGSDPKATIVREGWDTGSIAWLALTVAPIITFWPPARTLALLQAALQSGRAKHRSLYWHKPDPKPQVGGRVAWSVEPVWILSEPGLVLHGGTDLYTASAPRMGRDLGATGHQYEKPVDVLRWLIGKTTGPTVVDPFMGSGSTLVAAKSLGRRVIGIEQDERWCEIAANRCRQEVLGLTG